MADYIDRHTIIESIHNAIYPFFCGAEDGDVLSDDEKLVLSVNKTICTAIKELPSADVAKVVRCKNCKHWHREIHNGIEYFNYNSCDLNHGGDGHNFYCTDGEEVK